MEDGYPTELVSAFDFHVLRNAFKISIAELMLLKRNGTDHAKAMARELTGNIHVDAGIIDRIIGK